MIKATEKSYLWHITWIKVRAPLFVVISLYLAGEIPEESIYKWCRCGFP